jgi:tetratricopeptide (TPR) repeat protein
MNNALNNEDTLYRYLLGELDPNEELKVEERLIADENYLEQLGVVEDELIDIYTRGDLGEQEREKFERHFLVTPERSSKLYLAQALFRHVNEQAVVPAASPGFLERLRRSLVLWVGRPALGTAMAILVIGSTFGIYYLSSNSQSDMRKGLQALNDAYIQQRPVVSRISELNYAPYSVKRGDEKSTLSGQGKLSLDRAARIFLDLVNENPTPASYHAAGRYYLTQKDYVQAITQFNSALEADKGKTRLNNTDKARLQSDYGVALMEKAKSEKEQDPLSYEREMAASRDHLEEAVKLDNELPEALFNRALWLQEKRLWRQAGEGWNKYLERDPSSPWAEDAKRFRERAIEESKKQVSLMQRRTRWVQRAMT